MIGMDGRRESGKYVLAVWLDDDNDDDYFQNDSYFTIDFYEAFLF